MNTITLEKEIVCRLVYALKAETSNDVSIFEIISNGEDGYSVVVSIMDNTMFNHFVVSERLVSFCSPEVPRNALIGICPYFPIYTEIHKEVLNSSDICLLIEISMKTRKESFRAPGPIIPNSVYMLTKGTGPFDYWVVDANGIYMDYYKWLNEKNSGYLLNPFNLKPDMSYKRPFYSFSFSPLVLFRMPLSYNPLTVHSVLDHEHRVDEVSDMLLRFMDTSNKYSYLSPIKQKYQAFKNAWTVKKEK